MCREVVEMVCSSEWMVPKDGGGLVGREWVCDFEWMVAKGGGDLVGG